MVLDIEGASIKNKYKKMDFYDLSARTPQGQEIKMSNFKGNVVLIVNTATKCVFAPQFRGLESLHQKYKDDELVVLGFPCDQFKNQEPETNETVVKVCHVNFGVTFQLTEKIMVNGDKTHPIFAYLKNELRGTLSKKIKWNFTKFLISPKDIPFKRYSPTTEPEDIEPDIKNLLQL